MDLFLGQNFSVSYIRMPGWTFESLMGYRKILHCKELLSNYSIFNIPGYYPLNTGNSQLLLTTKNTPEISKMPTGGSATLLRTTGLSNFSCLVSLCLSLTVCHL